MVDFVNKPELSDQKYQTNGNLRDKNYNGKFLFTMKEFVSFGRDSQSMYLMSIGFLIDNINAFRVPSIPSCLHLQHNSSFT